MRLSTNNIFKYRSSPRLTTKCASCSGSSPVSAVEGLGRSEMAPGPPVTSVVMPNVLSVVNLDTSSPGSNVSMSTASEAKITAGKATSFHLPKFHANRFRCSASMSSLVCATIVPENCETDAFRPLRPKTLARMSATPRMRMKSVTICLTTLGCLTLTATSRPRYLARCTCAMEPDASGCRSNDSKHSSSGFPPSASSTAALVWLKRCRGAWEWSRESAAHRLVGNTSGLHDAHCPHLMNAVPALASDEVTIAYHTFSRNGGRMNASHESRMGGRKMTSSRSARTVSPSAPGGAWSTSCASSLCPMIGRSGGGRPLARVRRAERAARPPSRRRAGDERLSCASRRSGE
mmetsp:Transcript_15699/g.44046  ORF Transcript_15699/g.44046 Transcript_15699/m.44046 type:complete len:348 (+) Transcript_15699:1503-2546(+)